jgi:hypothetical protein
MKRGSDILFAAIGLIVEKLKKKHNLKYIRLRDNSEKDCDGIKIKLSKMSVLLTGDTWHMVFDFLKKSQKSNNLAVWKIWIFICR